MAKYTKHSNKHYLSVLNIQILLQVNMAKQPILEVSIPTTKRQGGHTTYLINLITDNVHFGKCYIRTHKRYSEFLKLHTGLKNYILGLPDFPPKAFFSRFSKDTIERRRASLEIYIRYICEFIMKNNLECQSQGKVIIDFLINSENAHIY